MAAGHAVPWHHVPCASAARHAGMADKTACMFQLNNFTKILKSREKMEPQDDGPSPPKKQKMLGKEEALELRKECIE